MNKQTTNSNNKNVIKLFRKARIEIEMAGWTISETIIDSDSHLICEKNGERRAWGLFDRLTCWSEAYKSIIGKDILTLQYVIRKKGIRA